MILYGGGGHARDILAEFNQSENGIYIYQDFASNENEIENDNIVRLNNLNEIDSLPIHERDIIVAVGKPLNRLIICKKIEDRGYKIASFISKFSVISQHRTIVGVGSNIMAHSFISTNVTIGKCVLVNINANIHHDVQIGDFCDIGPSAVLLGNVKIGNSTLIGSNATILPGISIGDNCIVGAGSLVTKHIPDNTKVKGNPAIIYE